jgi:hypothetical protein
MGINIDFDRRSINDFVLLLRNGQINLEPGFQRRSVWSINDRRRLIQSIISGYPVPNIFLYRRNSRGKTIYDVIDGKQRLETIFMFIAAKQFSKDPFEVRLDLGNGMESWSWQEIKRDALIYRIDFENYSIQTIEVNGDLADIVDLFVRINSTGKRLTSGERRHAQFYESPFLKNAEQLVHKHRNYLLEERILSAGQLDRMKGTELFSELLMSIHKGGPINKKVALDRAIGNESINGNTLARLSREFVYTLNLIKKMYPDIKSTRFSNTAELYSLFMLVWEMNHGGMILTDNKRNQIAFEILKRLSTGVDELRDKYRQAKPVKPMQPYSDYLLTVQGDTDSLATRERRSKILRNLLFPIYEKKDTKRIFSAEQRRILWNSDVVRKCANAKCRKTLTWEDFTVDHVKAHTKGGKTSIENAQLMCKNCNSSKGAK